MANPFYRNRLITNIAAVVREAADATTVEHPGLTGRIRELTLVRLLAPMLPDGFRIGTGKIVNRIGGQSAEIDLVIYNSSILPAVLHSERDGIFPIESSYYAIEVKSRLNATEVQDAIRKGRSVSALHTPGTGQIRRHLIPTVLVLFAYDSDLAATSSELDRYARLDPDWQADPVFKAICVVGRGYWYHADKDSRWAFLPPTSDHDEVIDLVSGITNTVIKNPPFQRAQPLGHYLSVDRGLMFIPKPDA